MTMLILLIGIAIIAIALLKGKESRRNEHSSTYYYAETNNTYKKNVVTSIYYQKKVLTVAEQSMYWLLVKAAGNEKIVLSQVAFSQIIGTKGGEHKGNFAKFAKARQKVADFVICNKDFSIKAIVELDDKSHNAEKDSLRDEITAEAGIKTYRYRAGVLPTLEKVMEIMK